MGGWYPIALKLWNWIGGYSWGGRVWEIKKGILKLKSPLFYSLRVSTLSKALNKCRGERESIWNKLYSNLNVQVQTNGIIKFFYYRFPLWKVIRYFTCLPLPCVEIFQINGHNSRSNEKLQSTFLLDNFLLNVFLWVLYSNCTQRIKTFIIGVS